MLSGSHLRVPSVWFLFCSPLDSKSDPLMFCTIWLLAMGQRSLWKLLLPVFVPLCHAPHGRHSCLHGRGWLYLTKEAPSSLDASSQSVQPGASGKPASRTSSHQLVFRGTPPLVLLVKEPLWLVANWWPYLP